MSNYINKKFNRWLILSYSHDKGYDKYYNCLCQCGTEKIVLLKNILNEKSKSCGCLNREIVTNRKSKGRKAIGESDLNHLYLVYQKGAKDRGLKFELSKDEFKNITSQNCRYCNIEPKQTTGRDKYTKTNGLYYYNGIDRVNNDLGYIKDNCVPCCKTCNYAKHRLSLKEFSDWIKRLVEFQK